jgi:signal transduction histidine kinase/DNA-binding response OmpR family regulator
MKNEVHYFSYLLLLLFKIMFKLLFNNRFSFILGLLHILFFFCQVVGNQLFANVNQPIFIIDDEFEERKIDSKYLYVFPDKSKSLNIETIQNKDFRSVSLFPSPSRREEGAIFWTKIIFKNELKIDQELWLSLLTIRSYGYLIRASGEVERSQTGCNMPSDKKTINIIKRKLANFLPIHLKPGERATFYIKSEYGFHLPILREIDRLIHPFNAELNTLKARSNQNLLAGFFHALLLILFLYCIFYGFYTKERYAFYLSIYCLIYSFFFLNNEGYFYEFTFLRNFPFIINLCSLLLINLAIIAEILFIQQYLSLETRLPNWNITFQIFILINVFVISFTAIYFFSTQKMGLPLLLSAVFQLSWLLSRPVFLFKFWQIKDIKIRIFNLAWTIGLLFSIMPWMVYLIPGWDTTPMLKLAIGSFASIMVISLSYHAAKSWIDKLYLEKESIQQQLVLAKQQQKQLEMEKNNQLLETTTMELRAVDQLKSRFFANISHELQTPLSLILGPINSVLKNNTLTEAHTASLQMAKRNGVKLQHLIGDILSLTKLEKKKLLLHPKPMALYPFFQRILASFESLAKLKGVMLIAEYRTQKDLNVIMDEQQLEKVLNNLLSNALKFTPNGGKVEMILKNNGEYIQVSIKDTGIGIDANDLPFIFDRYYQSSLSNELNMGGTGIGLALSNELTKLMKGKLWAVSNLGQGSTFYFEFPLKKVLGATLITPSELVSSFSSNQKEVQSIPNTSNPNIGPKILIVEDNSDLRQYLQMILSPYYQLVFEENGQLALETLQELGNKLELPQLLIVDWMMPILDGEQFVKYVKAQKKYLSIPIIMLTARSNQSDKLKMLRIGIDDYITKPFVAEELLVRIQNLLENYNKRFKEFTTVEPLPLQKGNDEEWLADLEKTILASLANNELKVGQLAQKMAMSRRNLERKLKLLTGLSPLSYIHEIRLTFARKLLEAGNLPTVKSVAHEVGYKNANYFAKLFEQRFGRLPSSYF